SSVSAPGLAALVSAVRRAVDALSAAGIAVDPVVARALDDVARAAPKSVLRSARAAVDQIENAHRRWTDERGRCVHWVAGQASNVRGMAPSGEDHPDEVLRQLGCGLPGDAGAARAAQVRAWSDAALAGAPAVMPRRRRPPSPAAARR